MNTGFKYRPSVLCALFYYEKYTCRNHSAKVPNYINQSKAPSTRKVFYNPSKLTPRLPIPSTTIYAG